MGILSSGSQIESGEDDIIFVSSNSLCAVGVCNASPIDDAPDRFDFDRLFRFN